MMPPDIASINSEINKLNALTPFSDQYMPNAGNNNMNQQVEQLMMSNAAEFGAGAALRGGTVSGGGCRGSGGRRHGGGRGCSGNVFGSAVAARKNKSAISQKRRKRKSHEKLRNNK